MSRSSSLYLYLLLRSLSLSAESSGAAHLAIAFILRALGMRDLASRAEEDPEYARRVALDISQRYLAMRSSGSS